ncbi:transcriptional regulator with XRE-family HTH domain [Labrenzia sp. EL_126]|nr:transcriptional regulator with XRE-family HTH domain [Labrenzia sp. EL_126]
MSIEMFLIPKEAEDRYFPSMSEDEWKNRLREALAARDATMHAVSLELKKNPHYISQLINRKEGGPNLKTVTPIAKALGVSPTWLLFGTGSMKDVGETNVADIVERDVEDVVDAESAREKITELVHLLSPQQTNAILTMLQSFLEALGIPEGSPQNDDDDIEDKVFLGDAKEPLERAWLEKASQKVRQQEKALTHQAIFNSEESDRRLKREYNRLYLQEVSKETSGS